MACNNLLRGYRSYKVNPDTNKRSITFKRDEAFYIYDEELKRLVPDQVDVPCGKCRGCRTDKAKDWAFRICAERDMYPEGESCFITLTYNTESLPSVNRDCHKCSYAKAKKIDRCVDSSLCVRDLQLFMKRLRKSMVSHWKKKRINGTNKWKSHLVKNVYPVGHKIRFFACGEYGSENERPHFHICLFNANFPDKEFWQKERGSTLYRSALLEKLWTYGFSSIGELSYQSAGYCARYTLKKLDNEVAADHYKGRRPEFVCMSRGQSIGSRGIGGNWLLEYADDIYNHDVATTTTGYKIRPPKYFDRKLELDDPVRYGIIKANRVLVAKSCTDKTKDISRGPFVEKSLIEKCKRLPRRLV